MKTTKWIALAAMGSVFLSGCGDSKNQDETFEETVTRWSTGLSKERREEIETAYGITLLETFDALGASENPFVIEAAHRVACQTAVEKYTDKSERQWVIKCAVRCEVASQSTRQFPDDLEADGWYPEYLRDDLKKRNVLPKHLEQEKGPYRISGNRIIYHVNSGTRQYGND